MQTCDARSASALFARPSPKDFPLRQGQARCGRVGGSRGRNRTFFSTVRAWRVASYASRAVTEHAAGIEPASPAWKAGASATRPRVRGSRNREERPAGVGPALLTWQASVQPPAPRAHRGSGGNRTRSFRFCRPATSHLSTKPSEETGRVELPGPPKGPAGVAGRCAEPTCTSFPILRRRRAEDSNP